MVRWQSVSVPKFSTKLLVRSPYLITLDMVRVTRSNSD